MVIADSFYEEVSPVTRALKRDVATKIWGIGWAKTGTTTLGECFKILGYMHQSQDLSLVEDISRGDMSRILALAHTKDTFEDWPWIILYKQLDRAFPGSRFVLTKREPENWLRSYEHMIAGQGEASKELNEIRRTLYGLPFPEVTRSQLIDRYEKHNDEVEQYFRDRPTDLLIVDWEQGDDWKVLCDFLRRDIPELPFPHANAGRYPETSSQAEMVCSIRK